MRNPFNLTLGRNEITLCPKGEVGNSSFCFTKKLAYGLKYSQMDNFYGYFYDISCMECGKKLAWKFLKKYPQNIPQKQQKYMGLKQHEGE